MVAQPITAILAAFIAETRHRTLPAAVEEKAGVHILDTVAAMVSGAKLLPGERALAYARTFVGCDEACVIGSGIVTSAVQAALVNGMLAHADETDDSHAPSLTHPGCAIVPAALAMAEKMQSTGHDLLRAVVVGYDVGTRVSMALGADRFFAQGHLSHAYGGVFGAAAAAAALAGLPAEQVSAVLAYAVQCAAANNCWLRDPEHVEKAFAFAGLPAQNGVLAASFGQAGFTACPDALEGTPGLFSAFPIAAQPDFAVRGLGKDFEIMRTAIKKWAVGSPIQAALNSLQEIMHAHGVTADAVAHIDVHMIAQNVPVVDNRLMANINLQQQLALMLFEGELGFAASHDDARMAEPRLAEMRKRIRLVPETGEDYDTYPRQATVDVHLRDGTQHRHRTVHVRGTPMNQMTVGEVSAKARDLMLPVIGAASTDALIDRLLALPKLDSVRALRPYLRLENPRSGA